MITNNLNKIIQNNKGLSVAKISDDTGLKQGNLYKIKSNHVKSYSNKTVGALCNYLMITPKELLNFSSANLNFNIIKSYSDDNNFNKNKRIISGNGCRWVHLVLNAINPHYFKANNKRSTDIKNDIGYFNFDTKITAKQNSLNVSYQFSRSLPLIHLSNKLLRPVNRNYLEAIANNKNNLVKCIKLAVSVQNKSLIKSISGTDTNITRAITKSGELKNLAPSAHGSLSVCPVINKFDYMNMDFVNNQNSLRLKGNLILSAKLSETHIDVRPSRSGSLGNYNTNSANDNRIFGVFTPGNDNIGGNGLNHEKNYYYRYHRLAPDIINHLYKTKLSHIEKSDNDKKFINKVEKIHDKSEMDYLRNLRNRINVKLAKKNGNYYH